MPRNRDYWNKLESHIRKNPHDLMGMRSTIGANEIRKLSLLVARHVKIHKNRELTISYIKSKLDSYKNSGLIEICDTEPVSNLIGLLDPIWEFTDMVPITEYDILTQEQQNEKSKSELSPQY